MMLRVAFHPLLLFLRWSQGISDAPEEHAGGGRAHVLELVLEVLEQFPLALPEGIEVSLDGTIFISRSKIVLAFSTVARIFFSLRTIPGFSIKDLTSRSDRLATFLGEKSAKAFRKLGHFFSTMLQFKPAVKMARDIRSKYPWSSLGGAAFHEGAMSVASRSALFITNFVS
jgi:hypothetical protein